MTSIEGHDEARRSGKKLGKLLVEELVIPTKLGEREEDRQKDQNIKISITLIVDDAKMAQDDAYAVDCIALSKEVERIVREKPRKTIELVAEDVAKGILTKFNIEGVGVLLKKYQIENASWHGRQIERRKSDYPEVEPPTEVQERLFPESGPMNFNDFSNPPWMAL
jgi:FolB domain-containing protein